MSAHALYRFFDDAGELLYVGITMNPAARWKQHSQEKQWWTEVANITVEPHPNRTAVLEAERLAVITEKPRYNVVHNRPTVPVQPQADARVKWLCSGCNYAIADRTGYFLVHHADLDQYRENVQAWKQVHPKKGRYSTTSPADWATYPGQVPWRAWHYDCDPRPDENHYAVSVEEAHSYIGVVEWTAHLMSKRWFKHTNWDQVLWSFSRYGEYPHFETEAVPW